MAAGRDIIEHGKEGFLVKNDADALAKGINKLLSDPQRIKRFSTHALKKAKTFDINLLGNQMLTVYEQAIEDKKNEQFVTLRMEETASGEAVSPLET